MDPKDSQDPSRQTSLPSQIGSYQILERIASGGMGEVFLAFDPFCKRKIALKKIRSDLMNHPTLKERFLREAKIAAQLSHPYIIPIYSIHHDQNDLYYTMPLVEGETLKEILRQTAEQEKKGEIQHPIGSSIPALMRIFLNICQAMAYSHSKKILHRDLKPENIIIGKYGEVLILDWGLADFIGNIHPSASYADIQIEVDDPDLTRPGKVAGTLAYLSPERILGSQASFSSDIYALGVILYQLLTLRFPFQRKSVKEFRKQLKHEHFIEPAERAPYRDIPSQLSKIVKKCLASSQEKRYSSLEYLLEDLQNYIEGHAEWVPSSSARVDHKSDWEFQENILLAKHIALTQKTDLMEWVSLMISKDSFPGPMKLETHVRITESNKGIGFLLNIKPAQERKDLFNEGFFLWIGSEQQPGCHLFQSNVELMANPELSLKTHFSHFIRIEKMNNHLRCYLDNILIFDYLSHIPFSGPHFGVVLKDADLDVGTILISSSSPNILVNCLAVPDAFLAHRHFSQALNEYRQITKSFPGRAEGREAIFRAGITLLEEAQTKKQAHQKNTLLQQALEEFGKLRSTPGAPLEYLGKSLVYKATHEIEEEIKCLELAIRKFPKHPLLPLLNDQVIFRLYEAAYKDRTAAYQFTLLALRHMPDRFSKRDNQKLLQNLQKHWELLPFMQDQSLNDPEFEKTRLCIQLAFWLAKPITLIEIIESSPSSILIGNALFSLLNLGCEPWVKENLHHLKEDAEQLTAFECIFACRQKGLLTVLKEYMPSSASLCFTMKRALFYLLDSHFFSKKSSQEQELFLTLEKIASWDLPLEDKLRMEERLIGLLLYYGRFSQAEQRLQSIRHLTTYDELSPFYFLQGCLRIAKEGVRVSQEIFDRHSEQIFPPSAFLIDHFLSGKISFKKNEPSQAFFWEKIQLLKQLALYYHCARLEKEFQTTKKRLTKECSCVYTQYSHSRSQT
jgi:eukaryotic-like serine/threonine-protein kinase